MRLTLAGVGGAFGAREDLSMQVHACMLALHTGKPVKMVYGREESFFGHVHRHPARLWYEHGADPRRPAGLRQGARSCSTAARTPPARRPSCANAATLGVGPYEVPNVVMDAYGAYTNNPPCGAMRGFGAVQACFAYESQMDQLAAALGLDPVELRAAQRADDRLGDAHRPGGRRRRRRWPSCCARVRDAPLPRRRRPVDLRELPGGVSNTTHGEGVRARRRLRRSASRTSASPRASTTTPPPGCGWR